MHVINKHIKFSSNDGDLHFPSLLTTPDNLAASSINSTKDQQKHTYKLIIATPNFNPEKVPLQSTNNEVTNQPQT